MREVNGGVLPDGYYYCDHKSRIGGFLSTDDYDEMIEKLTIAGLISQ